MSLMKEKFSFFCLSSSTMFRTKTAADNKTSLVLGVTMTKQKVWYANFKMFTFNFDSYNYLLFFFPHLMGGQTIQRDATILEKVHFVSRPPVRLWSKLISHRSSSPAWWRPLPTSCCRFRSCWSAFYKSTSR